MTKIKCYGAQFAAAGLNKKSHSKAALILPWLTGVHTCSPPMDASTGKELWQIWKQLICVHYMKSRLRTEMVGRRYFRSCKGSHIMYKSNCLTWKTVRCNLLTHFQGSQANATSRRDCFLKVPLFVLKVPLSRLDVKLDCSVYTFGCVEKKKSHCF